jgi:hypothetical protein
MEMGTPAFENFLGFFFWGGGGGGGGGVLNNFLGFGLFILRAENLSP